MQKFVYIDKNQLKIKWLLYYKFIVVAINFGNIEYEQPLQFQNFTSTHIAYLKRKKHNFFIVRTDEEKRTEEFMFCKQCWIILGKQIHVIFDEQWIKRYRPRDNTASFIYQGSWIWNFATYSENKLLQEIKRPRCSHCLIRV